jgi:hypothetical protein
MKMKTIILTLIALFNFSCMSAQEVVLKKGKKIDKVEKGTYYRSDSTLLNKYLGVWSYTTGNKTFKFRIFKKKTLIQGVYIDRLKAEYCYGDNCEIENVSSSILTSAKDDNIKTLDKGKLRFKFWDYEYQKFGELEFELLENENASFKLKEAYNPYTDKKGFSIPTDMTLTKLE